MRGFSLLVLLFITTHLPAAQEKSFTESLLSQDFETAADTILNYRTSLADLINQSLEESISDSTLLRLNKLSKEVSNISPDAQKVLAQAVLRVSLNRKDTSNVLLAYSNLGYALLNEGNYEESLKYYYKQLEYEENKGKVISRVYNDIGNAYYMMNDYDNSLRYLKKYLQLGMDLNDSIVICTAYLNISNPFYDLGKWDSSLIYLEKSLAISSAIGERVVESYALGNIASMYVEVGDNQKALDYQSRGLAIEEEFNDNIAMIDSHTVLAGCHANLGNANQAEFHLQKALDLAASLSAKTKLMSVYAEGGPIYEMLGNYVEAYRMSQLYHSLYDSLLNGERTEQVAEMREKYETAQKEAEIVQLEEEQLISDLKLAQSRNEKLLLSGAVLAMLIIAGLLYVFYKQVKKQKQDVDSKNQIISRINEELKDSNRTKDKFFALVAHDLRGPVTSLQGMGRMLDYYTKKGDVKRLETLTTHLDQATNSVSHLLDNLLKWALSQTQGMSFNPTHFSLNSMINDTLEVFEDVIRAKDIQIEVEPFQTLQVNADYNMISTVIRNLISNAIKFTPSGGKINLSIKKEGTSEVSVMVLDSGRGITEDELRKIDQQEIMDSSDGTMGEKGTGLGLSLCREFIQKHGQRMTLQNTGSGTLAVFSLSLH